jgi:predicted MPP superfamily phosphohydrolase
MAAYMIDKEIQPQCMLLLGDNFYGSFKDGVNCKRWKEQFSDIYLKKDFPFPFHALLGNHDHDLQHIEFEKHPTSFVISGGGGARLREPVQEHGPFAKAIYGFTHPDSDHQTFIVRHVDANRNILHSFEKKAIALGGLFK